VANEAAVEGIEGAAAVPGSTVMATSMTTALGSRGVTKPREVGRRRPSAAATATNAKAAKHRRQKKSDLVVEDLVVEAMTTTLVVALRSCRLNRVELHRYKLMPHSQQNIKHINYSFLFSIFRFICRLF